MFSIPKAESGHEKHEIIIVGSGPAGLTAGIYAVRGGADVILIGGYSSGGQLMLTTEVENYPGFPEPVMGPELMKRMREQVERLGLKVVDRDVTEISLRERPFKVKVEDTAYAADSVILAMGASARELNIPSEQKLKGKGVSYCAVCDGAFFKGTDVTVIGGGDTAIEDALYLSKIARTVTVVHRRDKLRAQAIMQKQAFSTPNIKFVWNSEVSEIIGEKKVEAIKVVNKMDRHETTLNCSAVFVDIGHIPNTSLVEGQVQLTAEKYIRLYGETGTSVDGVFAAGDIADHLYRQAITAAGMGAKAALDALRYLQTVKG
ncbi:MAG: thioredoxin-disulfide reductase [Nitrososphaerota archaeon]|jgi:thioredoxin reductase (NADPH)|nr:thioredoxin-disulfide reductase [Nitrososphaerota archaeon]MDG6935594.1 thioredoxin-disulfide reductase [Nitrososphaerota archaeon]MDG6944038.1 thioredoxin-disulfide reductase [Nitrososphaerota archaeon]